MAEPDFVRTTRASYDAVAAAFAEHFRDELVGKPWDRALLAGFAELARAGSTKPVADVGCGSGRVTTHLHDLGLPVFGVDLSPRMVAIARQTYPSLRFDEGSMMGLDLPDGALGAVVAYYSIIHIPEEQLPEVFAEFHRVLTPGGHLLLAFQVGDEPLHLVEGFGHAISLDFHRRHPDRVAELLNQAGLVVHATMVREPEEGTERTPQACMVARKPMSA